MLRNLEENNLGIHDFVIDLGVSYTCCSWGYSKLSLDSEAFLEGLQDKVCTGMRLAFGRRAGLRNGKGQLEMGSGATVVGRQRSHVTLLRK